MKHIYLTLALLVTLAVTSNAQTVLLSQNFDDTTWANTLPPGWLGSTDGFFVQNTNASLGYTGASGLQNLVIRNDSSATGVYTVQTPQINVNGFQSVELLYAVRASNNFSAGGSGITALEMSFDNGATWTALTYTNNPNNSTWAPVNNNVPIVATIPAGATTCILRWTANIVNSTSGTYRIDDLVVTGTGNTSTNTLQQNSSIEWYNSAITDGMLQISTREINEGMQLLSMDGKQVTAITLAPGMNRISVSHLPKGLYLLRDSKSKGVGKLVIM